VVAELLVRGGLWDMSVVDGDHLVAGNLVRHLLTLDHLDQFKASALADRLNRASPHASVAAFATAYPGDDEELERRIAAADLLLDCTASDEVLLHMEVRPGPFRTYVVLSVGVEARRLYAFAFRGEAFPRASYVKAIEPWLSQELKEKPSDQWPREGIGCWHPIFPARVDEIWLLAAASIQWLIEVTSQPFDAPRLTIFERVLDGERLIRLESTEVPVPYGN
jgi:molybdopterin/thiamine biosynthesis adenylyltransferase